MLVSFCKNMLQFVQLAEASRPVHLKMKTGCVLFALGITGKQASHRGNCTVSAVQAKECHS